MRETNIVYGETALNQLPNDGPGEEAHLVFTIADFSALVASYGPDKVMNDIFEQHPGIYAALCEHFYRDFYKMTPEKGEAPAYVQ